MTLLACLLLALPSAAQSGSRPSWLGSSSSDTHRVDAEGVLAAASDSFEAKVASLLALENSGPAHLDHAEQLPEPRRSALAQEALERFRDEVAYELNELQGDGVLLAEEVSSALEDLRESHLQDLKETTLALASGSELPPERKEYSTSWGYARALCRYVAVGRNTVADWGVLLAAVLSGITLGICVLRVSRRHERARQGTSLGALFESLHGPLYLLLATGGLTLGLRGIWLPASFSQPLRVLLLTLVVVGFFWAAWRLSAALPGRVSEWITPDGVSPGRQVLDIARKVTRLGVVLLFAFVGIELILGTDFTALLAGLGVASIAVTLAAQDSLKDLLAALTIHTNKPFSLGDLVRFGGYLGTIEDIGFRMTRLRTLDGHLVTIPNAKLVSDLVENVGARKHIRRRFHIDLPYDTPVERIPKVVDVVREVIQEAGELDSNEDVQVHLDELGRDSLRLLVQYHYESGDYWAAKRKASEIDIALVESFQEHGFAFAFPTQNVNLYPRGPGEEDEAEREESPGR